MRPDPQAPLAAVSRETEQKLKQYQELVVKWQKAVNLVSPDSLPDLWSRHIIDSAQLSSFVSRETKTIFDWGSGAGFPGLVLAMMRPEIAIHLVESDEKKSIFLQTVSRETKTPVTVHRVRIESFDPSVIPDVITARALAALPKLLEWALPWAAKNPDLLLLLPKGAKADEEIAEARQSFDFRLEKHPSQTSREAAILAIRGLRSVNN